MTSPPNKRVKISHPPFSCTVSVSSSQCASNMIIEDRFAIYETDKIKVFTVCDGHGGFHSAQYTVDNIGPMINSLNDLSEISIKKCIKECDEKILTHLKEKDPRTLNCGNTLVMMIYDKENNGLIFVSVGDSISILISDEKAEYIFQPEKAVPYKDITASVNMKSSLGDWHLKKYDIYKLWCTSRNVKCKEWKIDVKDSYLDPDLIIEYKYIKLRPEENFKIILASDGFDQISLSKLYEKRNQLTAENLTGQTLKMIYQKFYIPQSFTDWCNTKGKAIRRFRDDITVLLIYVEINSTT